MVSLRMNARVLSVLFESNWLWKGGATGVLFAKESAPFLPGGETTAPHSNKHGEVLFCLVQLLNVQCIM